MFSPISADHLGHVVLCGGQHVDDGFGVVAVIVLPYVGDSGEG